MATETNGSYSPTSKPLKRPREINDDADSESYRSCRSVTNSCYDFINTDLSSRYWGPMRNMSEDALIRLLEIHAVAIHGETLPGEWTFIEQKNGVYNVAYIFRFENGTKVALRVPACGWHERWNELDAQLLRSTALTMRLIGRKTTVPLPLVIAYDTSLDNEIGSPFLLMSCLSGQSARVAWSSDDQPMRKEERRQNLLRSLAQAISGIGVLRFAKAGALWFPNDGDDGVPCVGDSYSLRVEGFVVKRTLKSEEPYSLTRERVSNDVEDLLAIERYPDNCRNHAMKGTFTLFRLMASAFLNATQSPHSEEEFVLAHSDFDIQNVMTDEEGNVTGILDWDGITTEPRQAGCTMLPFWLQADWYSGHFWPPAAGVESMVVLPDEFDKYRADFARYTWEASNGDGDCRYTSKSHIYRAFLNSTSDAWMASRFVQNVLADILPRVPGQAYCDEIGRCGLRETEKEWLEARLLRFFKPVDLADYVEGSTSKKANGSTEDHNSWMS